MVYVVGDVAGKIESPVYAILKMNRTIERLDGRDFGGKVEGIAGATGVQFSLMPPENATGNYVKVVQRVPVRIVFNPGQDPGHLLQVGLSVEPRVRVH